MTFPMVFTMGNHTKKILYWNNAGTFPITRENSNFGLGIGRDRYEKAGCPVLQCETSEDRTDLLQYDVIIFNQHWWNWSDFPEKRSPHQLYIFFSYEPPTLLRLVGDVDQLWNSMKGPFFNWTMTYRWDSDIVNPYGWIEPLKSTIVPMHPDAALYGQLIEESHKDQVNYAAGKTKMAVFFQTSCKDRYSNRNALVLKLKENGVDIDLYGACHELQCAKKPSLYREEEEHELCMEMAARKYKFFIAFHNSICLDYTPERFIHSMIHSMIPIVMDLHGNHAKLAPPHSFINALDFPSPRHLANYLIELNQNDTLYNEYFWWKKHYRIRNGLLFRGMHYMNYCSLCAALHDPSRNRTRKSYDNIKNWWNETAKCQTVKFNGMYGVDYLVSNTNLL